MERGSEDRGWRTDESQSVERQVISRAGFYPLLFHHFYKYTKSDFPTTISVVR